MTEHTWFIDRAAVLVCGAETRLRYQNTMPSLAALCLLLINTCGCQAPLLESVLRFRPAGSAGTGTGTAELTQLDSELAATTRDELFDRAVHLRNEGRLEASRDALSVLLLAAPDHFAAIDLLAEVSRDLNDPVLYRASLQRLIQLRPDSATVLHRTGVKLLELARVSAVSDGASSEQMTDVADARVSSDVDAGLQSLRQAVTLEPHNRQFVQSLFGALVDLDRRTEAKSVLDEALQRNPRDSVLPLMAARFCEADDDWNAALLHYDAALRNDPANRVWMRQRAVCHFHQGDFEAAADDFSGALTGTPVAPQFAEYLMWSEACLKTGDYAAAQPVLDRIALTGNVRTAEIEMLRGFCRLQLNAYSEAGQIIADALVHWPQHPGLRRVAGQIEHAAARAVADAS